MSKVNPLLKEYLRLMIRESGPGTPNLPTSPVQSKTIVLTGPFERATPKNSRSAFTVELSLDIKLTPDLARVLGVGPEELADYEGEGDWTVGFDYSGTWSGKHIPQTLEQPAEYPEFDLEKLEVVGIGFGDVSVMLGAEDSKKLLHSIEHDKHAFAKVDEAIMKAEEGRADDYDDDPEPDDLYQFDDRY